MQGKWKNRLQLLWEAPTPALGILCSSEDKKALKLIKIMKESIKSTPLGRLLRLSLINTCRVMLKKIYLQRGREWTR